MALKNNYRDAFTVPAISAYYHAPPLWIGDKPSEEEFRTAPESEFIKDVYRKDLPQGIRIRVRRDGVFVFDCSSWEPGCTTEIPGYQLTDGNFIPEMVTRAGEKAQEREYKRLQLLIAHLACLGTAFGGGMRQYIPPQPSSMITLYHFNQNDLIGLLDSFSPTESYAYNHLALTKLDPAYRDQDKFKRRIPIPVEIIDQSVELLQAILDSHHAKSLNLVELFYKSVYNYTIHQFSESLILSWAICESLLNSSWDIYIEKKRIQSNSLGISPDATRINGDRKKRLEGIDFTASIVAEILELSDSIPHTLFCSLNDVRKVRNGWLHSLKDVSSWNALDAINTAKEFLFLVTGIDIKLQPGLTLTKRFYSKEQETLRNLL